MVNLSNLPLFIGWVTLFRYFSYFYIENNFLVYKGEKIDKYLIEIYTNLRKKYNFEKKNFWKRFLISEKQLFLLKYRDVRGWVG